MKVAAIVLAAGESTRFGEDKLALRLAGRCLIEHAFDAAAEAAEGAIVVVLPADLPRADASTTWEDRTGRRLIRAEVAGQSPSQGQSLRAGIAALTADTDAAFVFLGDMPFIPCGIGARLLGILGQHRAAAPVVRGQRGHPVLIRRSLFATASSITGDSGLRHILDRVGFAALPVDDDGVSFDIDTPDDFARAQSRSIATRKPMMK